MREAPVTPCHPLSHPCHTLSPPIIPLSHLPHTSITTLAYLCDISLDPSHYGRNIVKKPVFEPVSNRVCKPVYETGSITSPLKNCVFKLYILPKDSS